MGETRQGVDANRIGYYYIVVFVMGTFSNFSSRNSAIVFVYNLPVINHHDRNFFESNFVPSSHFRKGI